MLCPLTAFFLLHSLLYSPLKCIKVEKWLTANILLSFNTCPIQVRFLQTYGCKQKQNTWPLINCIQVPAKKTEMLPAFWKEINGCNQNIVFNVSHHSQKKKKKKHPVLYF